MNGLSQQDIQELLSQGHKLEDIQDAMKELQVEEMKKPPQSQQQSSQQLSSFQYNPTDNLIKWQLELNDILERAEHILREDVVVIKDGITQWAENPNKTRRIFNEYGVQEILRVLSMYINRNTILSDYDPKEIKEKVFDFGKEINDLIYMKYETMGLDHIEKRKNYPMLVRQLIDIVHSSYKRAQFGGERESLRTARQIQQSEQLAAPNINVNTGEPKKERGVLNPMRFVKGRYD